MLFDGSKYTPLNIKPIGLTVNETNQPDDLIPITERGVASPFIEPVNLNRPMRPTGYGNGDDAMSMSSVCLCHFTNSHILIPTSLIRVWLMGWSQYMHLYLHKYLFYGHRWLVRRIKMAFEKCNKRKYNYIKNPIEFSAGRIFASIHRSSRNSNDVIYITMD